MTQRRASQSDLSLSLYRAELVKRDAGIGAGWLEGYFDIFGTREGEPLERQPQQPMEEPG